MASPSSFVVNFSIKEPVSASNILNSTPSKFSPVSESSFIIFILPLFTSFPIVISDFLLYSIVIIFSFVSPKI